MKILTAIILVWWLFNPSVNAGEDIVIFEPRDSVKLNTTTQGSIVQYQWTILNGNPGAFLTTPNLSNTMVRGLTPGPYRFRITVFNDLGNFASDTVMVTVLTKNRRLKYRNIIMFN
jgi:hypothetical protein